MALSRLISSSFCCDDEDDEPPVPVPAPPEFDDDDDDGGDESLFEAPRPLADALLLVKLTAVLPVLPCGVGLNRTFSKDEADEELDELDEEQEDEDGDG